MSRRNEGERVWIVSSQRMAAASCSMSDDDRVWWSVVRGRRAAQEGLSEVTSRKAHARADVGVLSEGIYGVEELECVLW